MRSFLLLLIFSFSIAFGQKDTTRLKWMPDYFYCTPALYIGEQGGNISNSELISLIKNPGNRDFAGEMKNFKRNNVLFDTYGSPGFSFGIGYKLWDKDKGWFRHSQLRIELNYQAAAPVSKYYSYDTTTYVGTVMSGGAPLYNMYKDSISQYEIHYKTNYVATEVAQYFTTRENKWLSFYFGYSVCLGYSFYSKVSTHAFSVNEYKTDNNTQSTAISFPSEFSKPRDDKYRAKNSGLCVIGLPLGMQIRLSKEKKFFKQTMIGFELQPRYNIFYLPDIGFTTRRGYGLKFPVFRHNF